MPFGPVANVLGVDIDGPEGFEQLFGLVAGEPPATLEFISGGGGRRLLYRWQGTAYPLPTRHFSNKGKLLSFLADGSQTVLPPSLHRSGRRYEWPVIGGPELVEIAVAPPELVRVLNHDKDKKTTRGVGGSSHRADSRTVDWRARARAYCDACEPAITGRGGHVQLLKVATGLVRTLGLSLEECLEALRLFYNDRCQPVWSMAELVHKAEEASKRYGNPLMGCSTPLAANPGLSREGSISGEYYASSYDTLPADRTSSKRQQAVTPHSQSPASSTPDESVTTACHNHSDNGLSTDSSTSSAAAESPATRPTSSPAIAGPATTGHDSPNPRLAERNGEQAGPGQVMPRSSGPGSGSSPANPPPAPECRWMENVPRVELCWFLPPYVPMGMFTLLAGRPNAGKSTFLTMLATRAKVAVILPGFEEHPGVLTRPRFDAAGFCPGQVLLLEGRGWTLPSGKQRIIDKVKEVGADFVGFDPISSYFDFGLRENAAEDVRLILESANEIATATGAAVVGIRHPGKQDDNVLRGSGEWEAVPRVIIELRKDKGPPPTYSIDLFKDGLGRKLLPRMFELVGDEGKPPLFILQGEISRDDIDLAKAMPDPLDREHYANCEAFVDAMVRPGKLDSAVIYARAKKYGFTEERCRRAKSRLKIAHDWGDGQGASITTVWFYPTPATE